MNQCPVTADLIQNRTFNYIIEGNLTIGHVNVHSCLLITFITFQYQPIRLQYSWLSVEQSAECRLIYASLGISNLIEDNSNVNMPYNYIMSKRKLASHWLQYWDLLPNLYQWISLCCYLSIEKIAHPEIQITLDDWDTNNWYDRRVHNCSAGTFGAIQGMMGYFYTS